MDACSRSSQALSDFIHIIKIHAHEEADDDDHEEADGERALPRGARHPADYVTKALVVSVEVGFDV